MLLSMSSIYANENIDSNLTQSEEKSLQLDESYSSLKINEQESVLNDASSDLENKIVNAENGDEILIEPGTYKIHNIKITKNITLQGNGNARDIIIDGEKKSSIFLIRSPDVYVTFKNITFINGLTHNFGGVISIETGNVYVDECIFINNTALNDTNAGAISNYGTKKNRGYLLVNNSLFINNHADHDGGAITTCYANSDIYNCVFINNSAHRDGGAIRVSVFGYGNVQDCVFMFNHADEWGGAYYSWSGESNIEKCIFMNNTAGTNGGAVMVSGNINLESSIIVNNDGGETGGSFYIQQPMYDTKTVINVHDNLITNNTSPYGKEIFIKWWDSYNLYTQFDNNDWGDENPNDSSIVDPNNVTPRSKVSSTIKSNLYSTLNLDLLTKYNDLVGNYFKGDSFGDLKQQFDDAKNAAQDNDMSGDNDATDISNGQKSNGETYNTEKNMPKNINSNSTNNDVATNANINSSSQIINTDSNQIAVGNSTTAGEQKDAYELNKHKSVAKSSSLDVKYFFITLIIAFALLLIGYKRYQKEE